MLSQSIPVHTTASYEIQIGTEIFILRKGAFLHEVFQQIMKISTILLSVPSLTRAPLSFSCIAQID
jgi:hypothetical protein